MIRKLLFLFLLISASAVAQKSPLKGQLTPQRQSSTTQTNEKNTKSQTESESGTQGKAPVKEKATFDMYRVFTLEKDTTYIDTSLTIRKEYSFNYLRRDNFGLLPFANDGQTYNTLDFSLEEFSPFPDFGYRAKHINYLQPEQMRYYQVATPVTELYFKTTIKQGQSVDAFITLNAHKRLNFSIAYKGLRSLGRYVNSLSSNGNFRFTTNYQTESGRYSLKAHVTAQDFLNGENGGIINEDNFESGDDAYTDRARLQVYLTDAESVMKGYRYFFDHEFRINKSESENNLYVTHQFNYENKFFEFNQATIGTTITETDEYVQRFGDAYLSSNIHDKSRYNRMYNKAGVAYENKTLGKIAFFVEDFNYNYFYKSAIVNADGVVPASLSDRIDTFGGQYTYQKGNVYGKAMLTNSITDQSLTNLDAMLNWTPNDDYAFSFRLQKMNKLPNHNFNLFQSSYMAYNWSNDFKNEKVNNIEATAQTKWATASMQLSVLNDYLYFRDDSTSPNVLLVTPQQYDKTINYLSVKVGKEFKFRKFALDNTVLYQKVAQNDNVLNVPEILTRNTLYYSDDVFKHAMFIQTGVTLNYFTKYYANSYNPLIGEFYAQESKKIGNFPLLDFFINARVRQTRIYLKAEHFNTLFTPKGEAYAAPGYPYKDFLVRFGLVWTFFK